MFCLKLHVLSKCILRFSTHGLHHILICQITFIPGYSVPIQRTSIVAGVVVCTAIRDNTLYVYGTGGGGSCGTLPALLHVTLVCGFWTGIFPGKRAQKQGNSMVGSLLFCKSTKQESLYKFKYGKITRFPRCITNSNGKNNFAVFQALSSLTFALVGGGGSFWPPCGFSRITRKRKGAA